MRDGYVLRKGYQGGTKGQEIILTGWLGRYLVLISKTGIRTVTGRIIISPIPFLRKVRSWQMFR